MPLKPIKRGYKVWNRANSNGYISQFEIYTGKAGQTTEKCLGSRVVKTLTIDLFGKFHEVYFDNYFTSLPLMHYLRMNGVYACGTVRKHLVGLPSDFEMRRQCPEGSFNFGVVKDWCQCSGRMGKVSNSFQTIIMSRMLCQ
jgi:hypothetical protein